jgi:hypothetical protein
MLGVEGIHRVSGRPYTNPLDAYTTQTRGGLKLHPASQTTESEVSEHNPMSLDIDGIDGIARRIAWAHWKVLNPADVCENSHHLWFCLGDLHREAYRKAALEVVSM